MIVDSPDRELIDRFREESDDGDEPVYGKLMVCWDPDRAEARRTALEWWPVGGVGTAGADLRLPADFASVAANLGDDAAVLAIVVTDDLDDIAQAVADYEEAGVTDLALHQVGPRQQDFVQAFADRMIHAA